MTRFTTTLKDLLSLTEKGYCGLAVDMNPPGTQYEDEGWTRAKEVCVGCPVQVACLDMAMTLEGPNIPASRRDGVLGGLDPAERAAFGRLSNRGRTKGEQWAPPPTQALYHEFRTASRRRKAAGRRK